MLAPIIINIFAFHFFLDPTGMARMIVPVVLAALEIYLAWAYRDAFRPMLSARTTPTAAGT